MGIGALWYNREGFWLFQQSLHRGLILRPGAVLYQKSGRGDVVTQADRERDMSIEESDPRGRVGGETDRVEGIEGERAGRCRKGGSRRWM